MPSFLQSTFPCLYRADTALGGSNQSVDLFELPTEPQAQRVWGLRIKRLLFLGGVPLLEVGEEGLVLREVGSHGWRGSVLATDLVLVRSSGFVEESPGCFIYEVTDFETRTCPPLLS
jgi:hypothetical protein